MPLKCPICPFERAEPGYAARVGKWLADPHAFFRAFGPEARAFQAEHPSDRLRTMTLVAPAKDLVTRRPVCVCVDGGEEPVSSWEETFSRVTARLLKANPQTFTALQQAGELEWMGCLSGGTPIGRVFAVDALKPQFADLSEVVYRVQWLFLMCGFRLNEVIVQVDSYTDEEWAARSETILRRRAERKAAWEERRAAPPRQAPHF